MSISYIEPESGAIERFVSEYPAGAPVVMLNLLRFREQADYGERSEAACSGLEAFGRYGEAVAPLLAERGAELVWQGSQAAMLIGPDDKDWHLVALMRYPSAASFVDMISSEDYQAIVHHRQAALLDSRLIALQGL
ncbi:MAG: DUF1330 domain-containing protein [Pseudomonadota bacterium]